MFALEMNGVVLPVKTKTIRFRLRGQIFSTDAIPGGNTFPFEIAITKETQTAFNFPELLGNAEALGSIYENVNLLYKGNQFLSGYVLLLSARFNYRVSFNFGVGGIKPLGNRSLRSFSFGGVRSLYYPPGFPHLYAHAGHVAANPDDYDYLFPSFRNPSLYQDVSFYLSSREEGSEYFNHYISGAYDTVTSPGASFPFFYYRNSFIPFVKLEYIIRQIFAEAGISFRSTWLDDLEIKQLLVYNTTYEGGAFLPWNPPVSALREWATTFDLSKHVPDITVSEFLNALRNQFNLFFNWNFFDGSVSLDAFRDIHEREDDWDITEKIVSRAIIEPGSDSLRNLAYQQESNDSQVIDGSLISITNDSEGIDVGLKGSLIAMEDNLDDMASQTRSWLLPTTDQPGNAEEIPPGENQTAPFGLRLIFYRGMQPDSLGDNYPLASPGDRKYDGTEIAGTNYTLYPAGEKGLYEVWWKSFDEFKKNSRLVSTVVKVELEELLNLDLRRKVRIADSRLYINEVQFELGDVLSPAEFDLYRI